MGSIPACAGEPFYHKISGSWSQGLSPRVRGNPLPVRTLCPLTRSIPACAGEPR